MSFGVVPPLVRLRGTELLEMMRKATDRSESNAETNSAPVLPSQPTSTPTHTIFDQEPVVAADLWLFSKGDSFHPYPSSHEPEDDYRWQSTICSNNQVFIIWRSPHPNAKNLGRIRDKN